MTGLGEAHRTTLERGVVHVWRVPLDDAASAGALRPILSRDEQRLADRRFTDDLRSKYTLAHGWLRRILARYEECTPESLEFETSPLGKPRLLGSEVQFNLSHSGDIALVAVSANSAVGVDVERWKPGVEHLRLAERFFSPLERIALRELASAPDALAAGFFTAWSRKEAYLKARGYGISKGLHHFDVTLRHGEGARLIDDRLDAEATSRWVMAELSIDAGYSAAIVTEAPLRNIERFELSDYGRAEES